MSPWKVFILLSALALPARGSVTVDRVLARVNGDPIMMSQLAELLASARPEEGLTREQARALGLDRLIEESLVVFAAERANMTVDDSGIRAQAKGQIEGLRKEAGGTELFHEGLKKEALTEEELQEIYEVRLRRQALYFRMLQSKRVEIEAQASVGSAEVESMYEKDKSQLAEAMVRWIEFPIQGEKAGPLRDQTETKARRAKTRIERGQSFAQAAKESGGRLAADPQGGGLRVLRKDMDARLAEEAFARPEAEWGKPQFAALKDGFFVYQVDEIKIPNLEQERDRLRKDLTRGRVDAALKAWFDGLRKEAVIEVAALP